jgi:hypothetical protein
MLVYRIYTKPYLIVVYLIMNRDIVERSNSYDVLSEYLWLPKQKIKSYFIRNKLSIKNKEDVGNYLDKNLYKRWWVYVIENKMNGKKYIGSSYNIHQRWKWHKLALKKNNHSNENIQNDYNIYWENAFEYSVIEFINVESEYRKREQEIIDSYPKERLYNKNIVFWMNRKFFIKIMKHQKKVEEFLSTLPD